MFNQSIRFLEIGGGGGLRAPRIHGDQKEEGAYSIRPRT